MKNLSSRWNYGLVAVLAVLGIWVLGNNGTRNRCKRSMLGRKCLTFCERQANMEQWARICLQKSSAKAETCAATFAKPNRQPIQLYAFML